MVDIAKLRRLATLTIETGPPGRGSQARQDAYKHNLDAFNRAAATIGPEEMLTLLDGPPRFTLGDAWATGPSPGSVIRLKSRT